jgi:hypothetical protein
MRNRGRSIVCHTLAAAVVITAAAGGVAGQQPGPDVDSRPINVELDPIACWWRTSVAAIRVGEPFSIVLTCAVVESALTTVVPDQSELEPAALQLPPFEMMGGTRFTERRDVDHRFFQYEYRVRLIQENAFGTDVALPQLGINYRIQTRVPDGSAVDGREQVYIMPALSIRVLSLVANDAPDIRDATERTFADVDAQSFRGNLLRLVGVLLFGLAAIMALQTLVRATRQVVNADDTARQPIAAARVLRQAARELRAVQRQRTQEGWSDALFGRALTALRIVGAYALARRTGQAAASATSHDPQSRHGHLLVNVGWFGDAGVLVSGAVTAATLGNAIREVAPGSARRLHLEDLQTALTRFAAVQYGRAGSGFDAPALDESLDCGLREARRLALRQLWPVRKFAAGVERAKAIRRRVWSR